MRALPNRTNTPPGGWRYPCPETGKMIGPFNGYTQLKENIAAHYRAAGYEMPADMQQRVEQYICEQEKTYCGEPAPEPAIVKTLKSTYHTFHAASKCLATLVSHRAGSGEKPSMDQMEARARVCVACPQNTEITPCSVCNTKSLSNLIKKLVGAKPTTMDSQLKYCGVCHCANSAKIATKLEAIWKHMPEWQKEKLPETCWQKTEWAAQEAKYL